MSDYIRLDTERLRSMMKDAEWTERQLEGAVVRHAYRDHARERAEFMAKRERIAASLGRA
jgi:nuclear transport factor 2 (NTF2) superfamily protein